MKKLLFGFLSIVTISLSISSCKETGAGSSMLQSITGSTNELMVVMPKGLWEGTMGDTVKQFFGQPQVGLPQGEPVFDIINLPSANFTKSARAHRNILMVVITNNVDTASMVHFDSPWARTQKIFKITAPDADSFYQIFDREKAKMMGIYLKAERDRLIGVYKKTANNDIYQAFKNKYDLLLYTPGGYRINKDTNNFVWLSAETKHDSKGVIFFEEPYTHESQLNDMLIIDRVNEELKKNIPGPLDSTWMALDLKTPMTVNSYDYDNKHYAILIRGLWIAENDFMGGPFVLNVVLDEKKNRVIYMLGYVYAPEESKRNKVRQVESILYSMEFYTPEENNKEKAEKASRELNIEMNN